MVDAVSTLSVQSYSARSFSPSVSAYAAAAIAPSVNDTGEYLASRIRVDNLQNRAILEYRSTKTGEVVQQYPTEYQIRAFQQAERAAQATREREARQEEVQTSKLTQSQSNVSAAEYHADTTVRAAPAPQASVSVSFSAAPSAPAPDQGGGNAPSASSAPTPFSVEI